MSIMKKITSIGKGIGQNYNTLVKSDPVEALMKKGAKKVLGLIFKFVILPNLPFILIGALIFLVIGGIFSKNTTEATNKQSRAVVKSASKSQYDAYELASWDKYKEYKDDVFDFRLHNQVFQELDMQYFIGEEYVYYDEHGKLLGEVIINDDEDENSRHSYSFDPNTYDGETVKVSRKDFMKDANEALKTIFHDVEEVEDITTTYTYVEIPHYNIEDDTITYTYEWRSSVQRTKRLLVKHVETWEGEFRREYEFVTIGEDAPSDPSPGSSYTIKEVWRETSNFDNADYARLKEFLLTKDPEIKEWEIRGTIDQINMLLGMLEGALEYDLGNMYSSGYYNIGPVTPTQVVGNFPLFIQWNSQWKSIPYAGSTMGKAACGPTSLAIVLTGLQTDYGTLDLSSIDLNRDNIVDPVEAANFSTANGYAAYKNGTYNSLFGFAGTKVGVTMKKYSVGEYALVKQELQKGNPVVAHMGPGHFTKGGHYIVLIGIASDGKVIVLDPNSAERSNKTWDLSIIASEAKATYNAFVMK